MRLPDIAIEIEEGRHVQQLVDSFYKNNGSTGRARPDDVFFLAMSGEALIGCVRYCVESGTPLLRTMRVRQDYQRQGVGLALLTRFSAYLDTHGIRDVFCLPYSHLESFYGLVGFVRLRPYEAPAFLQERLRLYDSAGAQYLCMRRP
jgi:N-acetylglutamate synthase-like GNAT family acetyltransferase